MPASPELLLSLSPAILRSLLTTFASKKPAGGPPALARDIFVNGAGKKLSSILSTRVSRFSPRLGRLALAEATRASNDDPRADHFLSTPCADVAALLALQIEKEPKPAKRRALRRLFALAAHRIERDLPERPTYELVAEPGSTARDASATLALLQRALAPRLVDAWSATDPDGTHRFALFLKQPTDNRLVLDETTGRVVQRRDVPIAVDLVRISPATATSPTRVALTLAMPELLPLYASALSLSLAPSFTLRPLSDLTHATLAAVARATRGVSRIDVIAIRYRRPDGERTEIRAPDALASWHAGPRTGYIDRVTMRFTLESGAVVDAFLHLPHRVDISDRAFEAPVRAALSALGLFAPGALPDDARSLAPYEHGEWRWRAVLGDATFERLRGKLARLVRVEAAHVSTHEHRMHGAAYVVRDVDGEGRSEDRVQYALAEDRSLGARLVGPKDRVAWRLDTRALAATMTKDLGAQTAPAPLEIAGVLDLGVVTLASGKLRVVYAMAEPPAATSGGWVETVRRACGVGVTPVVLVPKGHAGEARGMLEVEIDVPEQLGARGVGRVLGRIAEALKIEGDVEPCRLYDEEVVIHRATERFWVTGVPVTFNEHRWKFVGALARHGGAVATKDLGAAVSKSEYPDVVARRMKIHVDRQVRRELEKHGADASIVDRMIVVEGRKGYRFGVSVRVL